MISKGLTEAVRTTRQRRQPPVLVPFKGHLIDKELLLQIDAIVYDAYCAGVNRANHWQDPQLLKIDTSTGELALKASLWCKKVGTR